MKKLIIGLVAVFSLYGGSAQAVLVDVVSGFGSTDIYKAQSNEAATFTFLNGVLGPPKIGEGQTLSAVDADGSAFEHIYAFTAIADTFFAVATTIENIQNGSISLFETEALLISPLISLDSDTVTQIGSTNFAGAQLGFLMVAGLNYAIVLSGDVAGDASPDYTLEVSIVPVPAAVWLFGTAMFGLFGMRRKQKMQAAAA